MMPPMPAASMGDDMFAMIAELARGAKRETSTEKVRRALRILEEVRKEDMKVAPILSMAIDMIRHGPEGLTGEGTREANNPEPEDS